VHDLLGLSRNPRILSFIARIDQERLLAARDRDGLITSAALYRTLLEQWIDYEWNRLGQPEHPSTSELWHAIRDLAERMWLAPGTREKQIEWRCHCFGDRDRLIDRGLQSSVFLITRAM